jgi:hypothetical protein
MGMHPRGEINVTSMRVSRDRRLWRCSTFAPLHEEDWLSAPNTGRAERRNVMKTESTLLYIVAMFGSLYVAGCGGGNAAAPQPPQPPPAPAITSLSPSSATAGGPQFTLAVTSANFGVKGTYDASL